MAKTKTKTPRRSREMPQIQAPRRRRDARRLPRWANALAAALLIALVPTGAFLLGKERGQGGSEGPASTSGGLPNTPDYHSLLVAPSNPGHILLGTHVGLYESLNGGRDWMQVALVGQDAMNLARSESQTVWTAGHNVFAKSSDGGASWANVRPAGLPSLDIHGFAVDPTNPKRLYAAVAGEGLYRSENGGQSFELVSKPVGGAVMALALSRDGRMLAGDMEEGLLASDDGGSSWRTVERLGVLGLAINPADPKTIVAAGPGILVSTDGGQSWRQAQSIAEGAGPVAWSPSTPQVGYAVGFDRTLYRTRDRGRSWEAVR